MTDPIQAQPNKHEHEIDFVEIITILWKARKFIGVFVIIFLCFGVLKLVTTPKMYIAKITLYPAQQGQSSPMAAMARQLGMAGANAGEASYNIPDVVKSRTLSEQIVDHEWEVKEFDKKVNLVEYFDLLKEVKKPASIKTKESEAAWHQSKFYGYSSMIAAKRLSVNTNLKTGLITVSVLMEQPKLAKDIANFISVFVANWVNDTQKESIKKNLIFINERSTVLGAELQDAENELKKFRETNRNILNSPDLQLELQRLQRQVTIKQEVYLTMIKQREINQIEENKSSDVIRILDKAIENYLPVQPDAKSILLFSFVGGLFFSNGIVFLFYYMDKRFSIMLSKFRLTKAIRKILFF